MTLCLSTVYIHKQGYKVFHCPLFGIVHQKQYYIIFFVMLSVIFTSYISFVMDIYKHPNINSNMSFILFEQKSRTI